MIITNNHKIILITKKKEIIWEACFISSYTNWNQCSTNHSKWWHL